MYTLLFRCDSEHKVNKFVFSSKDQFTYRKVEGRISTASVALGLARTSILGRQCQLTNLKKYTRYNVVVQAFNALGLGPVSSEVTATTLEDGNLIVVLKEKKTL